MQIVYPGKALNNPLKMKITVIPFSYRISLNMYLYNHPEGGKFPLIIGISWNQTEFSE